MRGNVYFLTILVYTTNQWINIPERTSGKEGLTQINQRRSGIWNGYACISSISDFWSYNKEGTVRPSLFFNLTEWRQTDEQVFC